LSARVAAASVASPSSWLAGKGYKPFAFQRQVWAAMRRGESGLLHAATGTGKTQAVWLGALAALRSRQKAGRTAPPLTVLWITPMRALAADTLSSLREPAAVLAPHWTLASRSGDSSAAERARQAKKKPTVLVTTPESFSLMLSQPDASAQLGSIQLVVVDEWHELIGNKRGVQVQLGLARLRQWVPGLMVWGLSATLANLVQAKDALAGPQGVLVQGPTSKPVVVDTLLPSRVERFPWAGHLGLRMVPAVAAEVEVCRNTLLFTNTRAQAELWYQALLDHRPDWSGLIALHHGSLDRQVREWVEAGLKDGQLKLVVATSSLDLGVDFSPVERVIQVGSVKGLARLIQRAGRSGHAPGLTSRITLVPTHSMELLEAAAARRALRSPQLPPPKMPHQPLDVLVQHVVTLALGGGFRSDELLAQLRTTHAYRNLSDAQWNWVLDFAGRGGVALTAYPGYHRIAVDEEGVYRVTDAQVAKRHRLSIGTIVGDGLVRIAFLKGAVLGTVEESFVARLSKGDAFLFAGRVLEFVRLHDMTAYVKTTTARKTLTARWSGGKMPLSSELAEAMLQELDHHADNKAGHDSPDAKSPEMTALLPLLTLQQQWSALPSSRTVLVETLQSREGHHVYVYPFAGRQVHLALGALWAWRLGRLSPRSFSISANDYGLELVSDVAIDAASWPALLSVEQLADDVLHSVNATEMARRHFREIARVAGLVFTGYPGAPHSMKQVQASSSLFYDVFAKYDTGNLLLQQARQEVLRQDCDLDQLATTLRAMAARHWDLRPIARWTPFAFPLMVERLRERLSTSSLDERIEKMLAKLNAAATP